MIGIYTRADQIRQMSDEDLAKILWKAGRNYRVLEHSPHKDWEHYKRILLEELRMPVEGGPKQPMCPYCNHKMTILALSPQFPPDLTHRYICLHCGAEAPKGAGELDAYNKAITRTCDI